jgi:Protein of unknown function (DUF1194)
MWPFGPKEICLLPIFRLLLIGAALIVAGPAAARESRGETLVDTALIVSVDVSGSVDQRRFALQMDGIAKAIEDPGVLAAMLSGPHASIMFSMVEWSEHATMAIPWTRIASRQDALALAARIRRTPRPEGEFTCVAHMMRFVSDFVLPTLRVKTPRLVMDVSGDGVDNCDDDPATARMRDTLVAAGLTINGLPINEGDAAEPLGGGSFRAPGRPFQPRTFKPKLLGPWYRKNVIGGAGAFLLPAQGYGDFDRAMREKFILEISASPAVRARFAQSRAAGRG